MLDLITSFLDALSLSAPKIKRINTIFRWILSRKQISNGGLHLYHHLLPRNTTITCTNIILYRPFLFWFRYYLQQSVGSKTLATHVSTTRKRHCFQRTLAIRVAVHICGNQWTGRRIGLFTDNQPITDIWINGTTKSPIMSLIGKNFMHAAVNNYCFFKTYLWLP